MSDDTLSIILPAIEIVMGLYAIIGFAVAYNKNMLSVILGVIAFLT